MMAMRVWAPPSGCTPRASMSSRSGAGSDSVSRSSMRLGSAPWGAAGRGADCGIVGGWGERGSEMTRAPVDSWARGCHGTGSTTVRVRSSLWGLTYGSVWRRKRGLVDIGDVRRCSNTGAAPGDDEDGTRGDDRPHVAFG